MTCCEKRTNSSTTTDEMTVTKPATHSDNWVENDVRIFCLTFMLHFTPPSSFSDL